MVKRYLGLTAVLLTLLESTVLKIHAVAIDTYDVLLRIDWSLRKLSREVRNRVDKVRIVGKTFLSESWISRPIESEHAAYAVDRSCEGSRMCAG